MRATFSLTSLLSGMLRTPPGERRISNRNDLDRGVRMALDDSREVYVMTYYPTAIAGGRRLSSDCRPLRPPGRPSPFPPRLLRRGRGRRHQRRGGGSAWRAPCRRLSITRRSGIQASVEEGSGRADDLAVVIHVDPADLSLAHSADRWTGSLACWGFKSAPPASDTKGQIQTAQLDLRPRVTNSRWNKVCGWN